MRLMVIGLGLILATAVPAADLALFPLKFLDTSHEAADQSADHARRLALMEESLAEALPGTLRVEPGTIASGCAPETADCLLGIARAAGAREALFVVVHKSSTLIMQVFATRADAETGSVIASPTLNFRGDTDESWQRAGRFLADQLLR